MIFIEIIGDFFKANTQCIYRGAIYKKMIAYIVHFVNQFLVFYIFCFGLPLQLLHGRRRKAYSSLLRIFFPDGVLGMLSTFFVIFGTS